MFAQDTTQIAFLAEAQCQSIEAPIRKSMSMSSTTTTDEAREQSDTEFPSKSASMSDDDTDLSCWGSPKQCWADLSEEDGGFLIPEWNPFDDDAKSGSAAAASTTAEAVLEDAASTDHDDVSGSDSEAAKPTSNETVGDTLDFFKSGLYQSVGSVPQALCCSMEPAPQDKSAMSETFPVTLGGIPSKLCNEASLDAILWAVGIQESALEYHTKKGGRVTIDFSSLDAAIQCAEHFQTCSWATGKLKVEAAFPSGTGRAGRTANTNRRSGKQTRQQFLAQQMWW